jgi:hypothetical protein
MLPIISRGGQQPLAHLGYSEAAAGSGIVSERFHQFFGLFKAEMRCVPDQLYCVNRASRLDQCTNLQVDIRRQRSKGRDRFIVGA